MPTTAETYHVPVLLKESVDGLGLRVGYEQAQHALVGRVPPVEARAQRVHQAVPYALGIEHKARLEHVLAHDEACLAAALQLLAERRREEHASLGVDFSFYVAEKTHFCHVVCSPGKDKYFSPQHATFPHKSADFYLIRRKGVRRGDVRSK